VTLAALAGQLRCSPRTVRRRLADWQAINSYNRNGSYYTLPEIAQFDANGLWQCKGAFFSWFGNLPATFVGLVINSQAGLTAAEAGDLLGLRPSSFLWSLRDRPELKREKHQGLYVYFCSDPGPYNRQRQHRMLMGKITRLPSDSEAIAIFVEKIKHPNLSNEALSLRLKKRKVAVDREVIENLFLRHNLAEKKTPHSI